MFLVCSARLSDGLVHLFDMNSFKSARGTFLNIKIHSSGLSFKGVKKIIKCGEVAGMG